MVCNQDLPMLAMRSIRLARRRGAGVAPSRPGAPAGSAADGACSGVGPASGPLRGSVVAVALALAAPAEDSV